MARGMNRPMPRPCMAVAWVAALALGLMLGGCFSETYQRGYIVPDGALEQIPIGSTQEQVLIVLGTPSTVATVSGEAFYYISQRAERPIGFMPTLVADQRQGRRLPQRAIQDFLGYSDEKASPRGVSARRILPPLRRQRQCASTASNKSATILVILIIGLT